MVLEMNRFIERIRADITDKAIFIASTRIVVLEQGADLGILRWNHFLVLFSIRLALLFVLLFLICLTLLFGI